MFYLSVFLPLVSFFICMIFNKRIPDLKIEGLISLLMIICSLISLYLFFYIYHYGSDSLVTLGSWLTSGSFYIDWSLNYNSLSILMVLVVNLVSTVVHIYSIGYMENDPKKIIFLGYLGLFTFFMLMLVTSSNLIQLFLGWEGVGLTSYLLIGFWNKK